MRRRDFLQLDVFAHRPGTGNPLAVVLDAQDLDTATMQAFANWTNLSETTFVLPPRDPSASYRVRIFTPRQELPFAGHPSVGTAHAVLEAGLAQARDGRLVQECGAGLLPLQVQGDGPARRISVRAPRGQAIAAHAGHLAALEAALAGRARGALLPALIDNGPQWWVVELADEAQVRTMAPDLAAITLLTGATGAVGLAVFGRSAPGSAHALAVRAFCPADGIPEDPVTGSANAAIAAWLHHNDALGALGREFMASQGREVGRDGQVHIRVDADGDAWVGGSTQTVIRGALDW
ncbi:MAG: PhzF family phenazine biosynthesis protein [Arenimonas sp.]|uniref:PhzF family phenazine biosynthesis protein n=1 Tax=Arenimonas sp. TaxID=1872635 RepID=UPI0025BA91D0|nr:PhzF family phenazine biosynthesis protein [Arenimonas sp.]MBW8366293.1 PhzF family phenazine biosynthesis protein [Arenimonas sp.]